MLLLYMVSVAENCYYLALVFSIWNIGLKFNICMTIFLMFVIFFLQDQEYGFRLHQKNLERGLADLRK